ncbi:MAG: TAXI family TRAP transporter solute-binding subunit [Xanthobacteraceae bacterium]|jgi:TRAP transporter TAXI family solute receptor
MQKLRNGRLIAGLAALALVIGAAWLVLEYLVPSPPFRVTIATGRKGTTFDYFGERYRAQFARAGIELNVRETAGALENLKLLRDRNSDVQIAFSTGGISDSTQAPDLRSMGLIFNVPFWVFYSSSQSLDSVTQLKGKRIAVGPEGSGARYTAERVLSRANIDAKTATLLPLAGDLAVEALNKNMVDAALLVGGSDAPSVERLLNDPNIRLMNFSSADAFTRVFPDLVRLVLPKGVVQLDPPSPPDDITLVGTTAKVLIRGDLHPAIVQLLAQTLKEEHGGAGLFQRTGEFPAIDDPEYPVASVAIEYYRNGSSLLPRYLPLWMTTYVQRTIAFLVATLAIAFPAFGFAPRLYEWFVRQRFRQLYQRLRSVDNAFQAPLTPEKAEALQAELNDIDRATSTVPMRHSDLYFMLRYHLDRTRYRLVEASRDTAITQTSENNGNKPDPLG